MLAPSLHTLAASLLLMGVLTTDVQDAAVESAQPAPAFSALDHQGETVTLEGYVGDVALLCFHSAAMSYSRRLIDELTDELRLHPAALDRTVLLVVARGAADLASVERQLAGAGVRYRIIPDRGGKGLQGYSVVAYPTVFCISPQSMLTDVIRGYGPHAAHRIVGAARFALGAIDTEQFEHIQQGLPEASADAVDTSLARSLAMVDRLLAAGRLDSAGKALQALGEQLDGSARGLALLARVLLLQGQTEQAHAHLATLAVLDPDGEVGLLRIRLHILEGDLDRAQAELEHLPGEQAELSLLQGMVYESQDRWHDAALLYREVLERLIREQGPGSGTSAQGH